MNKRPQTLLIALVIIIFGMFTIIFSQNNNAPEPSIGADREGGIIFGGAAPQQEKPMTDTDFTSATDSNADESACE